MDPNANIIFGALVDESMNGEIAITVIATGFPVMSTADALTGKRMVTGAGLMRKLCGLCDDNTVSGIGVRMGIGEL